MLEIIFFDLGLDSEHESRMRKKGSLEHLDLVGLRRQTTRCG
jgi:hypothetical protein